MGVKLIDLIPEVADSTTAIPVPEAGEREDPKTYETG